MGSMAAVTASGPQLAMGRVVGSLCVITARDEDYSTGMIASWVSQVREAGVWPQRPGWLQLHVCRCTPMHWSEMEAANIVTSYTLAVMHKWLAGSGDWLCGCHVAARRLACK